MLKEPHQLKYLQDALSSQYEPYSNQINQTQANQQPLWFIPRKNGTVCRRNSDETSECSSRGSTNSYKWQLVDQSKNQQIQIDMCAQSIDKINYNPVELNMPPRNSRFFVIKSLSATNIYQSIKHNVWCSTAHGNQHLDEAYATQPPDAPIYLFFSSYISGFFHGMAQLTSRFDFHRHFQVRLEKLKIDYWYFHFCIFKGEMDIC